MINRMFRLQILDLGEVRIGKRMVLIPFILLPIHLLMALKKRKATIMYIIK